MSEPAAIPLKHRAGTDRDLVVYPAGHIFPEDDAMRRADFIARSRDLTCQKVAEETRGRDLVVVVWIAPGGEYRAERFSRTQSTFREFVPDYLTREYQRR